MDIVDIVEGLQALWVGWCPDRIINILKVHAAFLYIRLFSSYTESFRVLKKYLLQQRHFF
jgi:hypothetical protein